MIFGKLKKAKKSHKVPENAEQIRAAARKLKDKLASVRFENPTGEISQEDLTKYQHMINTVIHHLDSEKENLVDTRQLDIEMLKMTDYLNGAIRSGKAATVKYIVHALMYGVEEGHKALLADEVPKAKEILAEREERFEKYKKIVDYSRTIDDYWRNIVNCEKSLQQVTAELKDRQKEVEDELAENPHLAEQLEEYDDDNDGDKLSPGAKVLAAKVKAVIELNSRCMLLKKQIICKHDTITSIEQLIKIEKFEIFEMTHDICVLCEDSKQQRDDRELIINLKIEDSIDIDYLYRAKLKKQM